MQLSKLENKVYEEIKKNKLVTFSINDLSLLLKFNRTKIYNIIKALKRKKIIKNIGKRKFSLWETNEFEIASELNFPSYISFWSALNYYGFSDDTPNKIFIVTTKYSKDLENFKYITLSNKRFFGYISVGNISMAEKEKSIIDSLILPKYAGGIKEIKKSLENALSRIDLKKLILYALKVKSKIVIRRLGYLLETLKVKNLKKLEKEIGKGFELLDPTLKKKNNLNKKWLLDINI